MSPRDSLCTSLLALLCFASPPPPPSPSHVRAPPFSPSPSHTHANTHTCTHGSIIEESRSLLADMCTVAYSIDVYSAPALAKTAHLQNDSDSKHDDDSVKVWTSRHMVTWNLKAGFTRLPILSFLMFKSNSLIISGCSAHRCPALIKILHHC